MQRPDTAVPVPLSSASPAPLLLRRPSMTEVHSVPAWDKASGRVLPHRTSYMWSAVPPIGGGSSPEVEFRHLSSRPQSSPFRPLLFRSHYPLLSVSSTGSVRCPELQAASCPASSSRQFGVDRTCIHIRGLRRHRSILDNPEPVQSPTSWCFPPGHYHGFSIKGRCHLAVGPRRCRRDRRRARERPGVPARYVSSRRPSPAGCFHPRSLTNLE